MSAWNSRHGSDERRAQEGGQGEGPQYLLQAGMSTSAYMVACALPEEDEMGTGCALVLSEADQGGLLESVVERLEGCIEALLAPGADTGLSLLQGLGGS